MVFDGDETPYILAASRDEPDSGVNWRTVLLKFENQIPQQLWKSTNAPRNASAALRRTRSGIFEAVTLQEISGSETRLFVTTIAPSGAELSNVRLLYKGGGWSGLKALPAESENSFLVLDMDPGRLGAPARISKIVNETLPFSVVVARDGAVNVWPSPLGVDNKPVTVKVTDAPQRGTLTGAWPNWIYTPSPEFTGEDRIGFRASQPGEAAIDGEFKIKVVAPLNLSVEQNSLTLTKDPGIDTVLWSRDLKEWTLLREPLTTTNVLQGDTGSLFFRIGE